MEKVSVSKLLNVASTSGFQQDDVDARLYKARILIGIERGTQGLKYCLDMLTANLLLSRYEKVPVILVGNKVDLESEREVSSSEGRALAEEWGCPFMETSAKSKTMVDELFAEIVRQMNYAAQPDKDDPCCSACNIQ
ncbi:PREDICTED: ras-related protein Rap-2a [Pygoscelis adeliae]|uniref:ras-related protein Rap-2a n=1 Tax=Pygoscelis adeliae TaxID=9238 RepID=UPI0004F4FA94|nr:PREDICTED: ras-related protein Rap-2a [Pygoscelis adeliae]